MSSDKMYDDDFSLASLSCNSLEHSDDFDALPISPLPPFEFCPQDDTAMQHSQEGGPEYAAPGDADGSPNPQQATRANTSVSDNSSTSDNVDGEAVDEPPHGSSHLASQRKRKRRNPKPRTESKTDAIAAMFPSVLDIDVLIGYTGPRDTSGQRAWRRICEDTGRKKLQKHEIKSLQEKHLQMLVNERKTCNRDPLFLVKYSSENKPETKYEWTHNNKTDYWMPAPLQRIIKYVADFKPPKSACPDTLAIAGQHNVAPPHDDDIVRQLQHNFAAQLNVSVPFGMGHPDFKQIMKIISECKNVGDCEFAYLDTLFQACLQRITDAQQNYVHNDHSSYHRLAWAKDWAEKLKKGDPLAQSLNADRKVGLELLYKLCNLWKPKDPATTPPKVTKDDIVNVFKDNRVKRILYCCLPMDRANALYNMNDWKSNLVGMHWYSHKDMEAVDKWRALYGDDRGNKPTINKRLTWLFELSELGLDEDDFLKALMEPCRTPLAFAAVSTGA